jgi:pSer/pThr/pTyr-binding forkhead associated (FHA) protein
VSRKLVIDDGRAERELLVVGTMVVGRDPECEISSSDPRLSRKHAEFRSTQTGVVVRDLGSRNGVRVNGKPVTEASLEPGDIVSIAHLSVRFLDETAFAPVAPRPVGAPVTIAAPIEDDRTRAVPKNAISAAPAAVPPADVRSDVADDRTRVLPAGSRVRVATAPTQAMAAMPADAGEVVIRERSGTGSTFRGADPVLPDASVGTLAATGWGRRVLLQGILLSLIVFIVTVIPLLAWQTRAFNASALQAWSVLVPTLGASVFAGIMVAALIARTAIRGAHRGSRSETVS